MPTLHIPESLSAFAGHQQTLSLPGTTVAELLAALTDRFPELARHLLRETGEPRRYVCVYLNDVDIRGLQGVATPVEEADTLVVVPSIAGG